MYVCILGWSAFQRVGWKVFPVQGYRALLCGCSDPAAQRFRREGRCRRHGEEEELLVHICLRLEIVSDACIWHEQHVGHLEIMGKERPNPGYTYKCIYLPYMHTYILYFKYINLQPYKNYTNRHIRTYIHTYIHTYIPYMVYIHT